LGVFSLIDADSLVEVERLITVEARKSCPDTPVVLVGTKVDLRDHRVGNVVGHAGAGNKGYVNPKAGDEVFNPVSRT